MSGDTMVFRVHLARRGEKRVELRDGPPPPPPPAPEGSVPRLARLMALALRFESLVRSGEVADYAEIARLGHVSRARVAQITNLLLLAPDIQEAILFLPRTLAGRDPICEGDLRGVVAELDWNQQRKLWAGLAG